MIFLESPVPIIVIGILAEAVLVYLLIATGQGKFLLAMLGVLALVGIGVLVERLVVTERERVEATIDGAAAALQANDLPRLKGHLATSLGGTLQQIDHSYYLNRLEFFEVKARNLDISINDMTSPPTAEVVLDGTAYFRDREGVIIHSAYSSSFRVMLVKEPEGWKIEQVEDLQWNGRGR